MITKKLAVPLINDKILLQAEHCYIATASISDAGFDFVRSRIPVKCKIDMVTGLDGLTSPNVLQRILRHYQGRITLNVYTRNVLHANVYIFDLPYRKSVAFVGSGSFSLEGLKDHEELFWKITDPKEIESLMSWFTGYYEFGVPLSEALVQEYELLYPVMKQREIASLREKQQLIALTASGFNWDTIRFRNQYFKKEDYLAFSTSNASSESDDIRAARRDIQNKLVQLRDSLKDELTARKLDEAIRTTGVVDSIEANAYPDQAVRSMWVSYGKTESGASPGFLTLEMGITPMSFNVRLRAVAQPEARKSREHFYHQMETETYRSTFFNLLSALGPGYTIEVTGVKRPVESFQQEQTLWEFIKVDYGMHFDIIMEKKFSPGDPNISNENIATTLGKELALLASVYQHLHHRP